MEYYNLRNNNNKPQSTEYKDGGVGRSTKTLTFKYPPCFGDFWDKFAEWVKEQEGEDWILAEHHSDGYDRMEDLAYEIATFVYIR